MKLYISGGIAGVPAFREQFDLAATWLEQQGYEVVNPCSIVPECDGTCLTRGELGTPDDPHSWACFLRWDLIEMLKCDGVAVIMETFWNSKGAHLEEHVAMQCGMRRAPVEVWANENQNFNNA